MKIKVVSHVHSEWSYDASWTLEELRDAFAKRGYRVILTTEHDRFFDEAKWQDYRRACEKASDERVLIVPGMEYSDAANDVHVLVWGDLPFLGEGLETEVMLQRAHELGASCVLAHPRRREVFRKWSPNWAPYLIGIEAWNRKTDGWAPGREALRLLAENPLVPFASLDFHRARQFFPLAMELNLDGEIDRDTVYRALRSRRLEAMAFGRPLAPFCHGLAHGGLRAAEAFRRTTMKTWRRITGRRAGKVRKVESGSLKPQDGHQSADPHSRRGEHSRE